MATVAENLTTAYENLAAQLAEISANPRPSYNLDGQSVNWEQYMAFLVTQMEALQKAIQRAQSPFWKISRAKA